MCTFRHDYLHDLYCYKYPCYRCKYHLNCSDCYLDCCWRYRRPLSAASYTEADRIIKEIEEDNFRYELYKSPRSKSYLDDFQRYCKICYRKKLWTGKRYICTVCDYPVCTHTYCGRYYCLLKDY